jgi:hypothetical protein
MTSIAPGDMDVELGQRATTEQVSGSERPAQSNAEERHDACDAANAAGPSGQEAQVLVEQAVPEGAQGVTAFFLFSNVHRERVKAHLQISIPEGGKVTVGMVGKCIGSLWKDCSDEVKAAYASAAKEVRYIVAVPQTAQPQCESHVQCSHLRACYL